MKNKLVLICLLSSIHLCLAQTPILDSLKRELGRAEIDTAKIDLLNSIGVEYIYQQADSAKAYVTRAHTQSIKEEYRRGQAISLNYLGRYYSYKGQYTNALDYFLKSLTIQDYADYARVKAVTYYDLGQLYASLRMYSNSDELFSKQIFYFKESIEAFHLLKPKQRRGDLISLEAGALSALGQAYLNHATDSVKLDSAVYFFTRAFQLGNEIKSFEVSFAGLEGIANVYRLKHQYSQARKVGHQLLSMSRPRKKTDHYYAGALVQLGGYHYGDNYDSAVYYFNESLKEFRLLGSAYKQFIPAVYSQLGQLNFHNKYYLKAIKYFALEIEISKEIGNRNNEISYLLTSESYKALGDYKRAFEFQSLYYARRDSLFNEDTSAKLARQLADFESAKQQTQIDLLEKEARVKELLLRQKQDQQIIVAGVAILFLVVIGFLFARNLWIRKAKKDQEELFQQIDQLKSRFFANISHEFRTPLTLLLGPIEKHLARSAEHEDRGEFIVMHRNASRLLRLVNQLLDLSRFEAGTMKLQASKNDFISFITTLMSEFQSNADSRNIQFKLKHSSTSIELYFDPDKLEKIANNLFSNAFKFTAEGGCITVEIAQQERNAMFKEGYLEFKVNDTGIGIAPQHLPKLFDRFYQVDNSTTRAFEGSGIGLALTKELVELHHGRITVSSQLGVGTSFIVQLPMGKMHLRKSDISIQPIQPGTLYEQEDVYSENNVPSEMGQGEVILIIEDNADLREYLLRQLSTNYRVILAKDGIEGTELALREVPSLILSDLMMPKKDGLKVCDLLKEDERTSHIPFILLTAKTEVESRMDGFRKGADDYIAKPFSITELQIRIENLIEGRKKLQKKYAQNVISFKPFEIEAKSVEERFLNKVVVCMEAHIHDSSFGVESFAYELGMSQVQLYRKLTALTSYSPNEFIRHMRLERAADLLKRKAGNVAEIAYQSGFNNLSYFSKIFKEKYSVTPTEYVKQNS